MKSLLELRHKARTMWPDKYMQHEWLRAIKNARQSNKGWILDQQVKHKDESSG